MSNRGGLRKWCEYRGAMLLALILFVSLSVAAQLPTGTILGTVKDSTGGAIAGATVTVTNIDTGFTRTGPTMDDGSYRFPALPVGNYDVKIMKEGFQTLDRTGLTLTVGADLNLALTLQVGSTSQNVVVTGEAPLVDTTSSALGNLVNDAQVTDLPLNGRNWTDLTLMQPGITQINAMNSFSTQSSTPDPPGLNGTLYSSNGATARSNAYFLDGADERTMIGFNNTSATNTSLGVDGIKEYDVVSAIPSAEYGLVMGSTTAIVSKGGTNQWHGDAFDFLRNSSMDAENYNQTLDTQDINGCGTDKLLAFPCKRVSPFKKNQFGGSFGGPIQKDKTFFYAVFEGIQQRYGEEAEENTLPAGCFVNSAGTPFVVPSSYTGQSAATSGPNVVTGGALPVGTTGVIPSVIANNSCVPGSYANPISAPANIQALANYFPVPNLPLSAANPGDNFASPYTVPTSEEYGQIRVDRTISANDSVFGRYTQDDATELPLEASDTRELDHAYSSEIFGTLSETHIFTPTLLSTFRFSVSRNQQYLIPETVASTVPGVPNQPINSSDLFVTDISNLYGQPGAASPGQIPQLPIPGCTNLTSASCYSTYGGASAVSSYATPGYVNANIYTLSDDVFWTKGKHAFKFGTLINRNDDYVTSIGFATGTATFPGTNTPIPTAGCANANSCPLAAYFEGVYSALGRATPNSQFQRFFRDYTYGFYAQDDYKALSGLTLNLGFRYEFVTTPNELLPGLDYTLRYPETQSVGTEGPMFTNPSLHNFSPRIGFAWDVFGNGKTSVRGGGALLYDIGTYGSVEESNGISTPNGTVGGSVSGTVTYTNPDIQNLPGATCCSVTNTYRPGGPGSSTQAFTVPLPLVANTAVASPRDVQYNLQQPTELQRSLGIDQQLPGNMALSVTYVGSRAWHLFQEREGNPQAYYAAMIAQPSNAACDTGAGCAGDFVATGTTSLAASPITLCPSAGCTAITLGSNGLPYYCSPADGTAGAPSAAHPCFSNAASIACTTLLNSSSPSCPGKTTPAWNQVSNVTTSGDSYFNSLQVVLNKRTSHGLQMQFAYTWEKLLGTGEGQSTLENAINYHEFPTSGGGPDGTLDRGPAEFNATNSAHVNIIYRVPDLVKSEGVIGKVVNGWGVSAIETIQSGYPQTLSISGDRTLDGSVFVTERPDLCPGYSASAFKSSADNTGNRATSTYFNTSMICLPASGVFGDSAIGQFTGPGILTTNAAFTKDTRIRYLGEAGNLEFRFEMFNALNHPNFGNPNTAVFTAVGSTCPAGGSIATLTAASAACGAQSSPTAGRDSLGTLLAMREMQASLKIVF